MKLAVLSDLHLEISPWEVPARTLREADVIVLAGDIGMTTHGLHWAPTVFREESVMSLAITKTYGGEIYGLIREMRQGCRGTLYRFYGKDEVVFDGVRFLGTTLWTDFQLFGASAAMGVAMREAGKYILDFDGRIRCSPMPTSVQRIRSLHRQSRDWLRPWMKPFDGKTVCCHHTMRPQCAPSLPGMRRIRCRRLLGTI